MKDCIKCGIICLGVGMIVGGIVVAKNKKLANGINQTTSSIAQKFAEMKDDAEEKVEELKEMIEEKVEESSKMAGNKNKSNNKK